MWNAELTPVIDIKAKSIEKKEKLQRETPLRKRLAGNLNIENPIEYLKYCREKFPNHSKIFNNIRRAVRRLKQKCLEIIKENADKLNDPEKKIDIKGLYEKIIYYKENTFNSDNLYFQKLARTNSEDLERIKVFLGI